MTPERLLNWLKTRFSSVCLMIKSGDADGEIAGARNTTGNILRPALQIIRTAPRHEMRISAFLMFVKKNNMGKTDFSSLQIVPLCPIEG